MNLTSQIARHIRELHFGGNPTGVSLKTTVDDLSREEAVRSVSTLNSIAMLVFHVNYYVDAVLKVLRRGPLDAHDRYSFDVPPIESDSDWRRLLDKVWADAESLAALVEQMPDEQLWDDFAGGKYGNWYRNLQGIIEHTHYHLGQMALIRKLLRSAEQDQYSH